MLNNKHFTAKLVSDVEYDDLDGNTVLVSRGEIVVISKLAAGTQSDSVDGQQVNEPAGSFIATKDNVSFDVSPSAFVQVHCC